MTVRRRNNMKIILLILAVIILGMLWALPVYICANLVLWLFHIPFRWTLLQTFGICLFVSVVRAVLFSDKGGK